MHEPDRAFKGKEDMLQTMKSQTNRQMNGQTDHNRSPADWSPNNYLVPRLDKIWFCRLYSYITWPSHRAESLHILWGKCVIHKIQCAFIIIQFLKYYCYEFIKCSLHHFLKKEHCPWIWVSSWQGRATLHAHKCWWNLASTFTIHEIKRIQLKMSKT